MRKLVYMLNKVRFLVAAGLLAGTVTLAPLTSVSAASYSSTVLQAQTIMRKFALPTGAADGYFGPQTAQGLCSFRYIAHMSPTRGNVDSAVYASLRSYNSKYSSLSAIPAPSLNGHTTYAVVQQHCQVMFYVSNGHYARIMSVTTGMPGHSTPNGYYLMGGTHKGWTCSNMYPETCSYNRAGRFAYVSHYGNMYNMRSFRSGGYYVHGSTDIRTYPASHGCIRVSVSNSDWMYDNVGNYGPTYLLVTGSY